jgi:hypothetical protein
MDAIQLSFTSHWTCAQPQLRGARLRRQRATRAFPDEFAKQSDETFRITGFDN